MVSCCSLHFLNSLSLDDLKNHQRTECDLIEIEISGLICIPFVGGINK